MMATNYVIDFRFLTTPMDERQSVPASLLPATTIATGTHPHHVLVVDDEPAILEVFHEMLSDAGYRVTGVDNVPTPREIVYLAPDAIVLDLIFGGRTTGLELLRELRSCTATAAIPIVVCTALTDRRIAETLNELRAPIPVLAKPFDIDEAVAVVRAAIDPSVAGRTA